MAATQLERAEQRMQQRWYDLVMAEQNGAIVPVLERLYTFYILAVEEYNRFASEDQIDCDIPSAQWKTKKAS